MYFLEQVNAQFITLVFQKFDGWPGTKGWTAEKQKDIEVKKADQKPKSEKDALKDLQASASETTSQMRERIGKMDQKNESIAKNSSAQAIAENGWNPESILNSESVTRLSNVWFERTEMVEIASEVGEISELYGVEDTVVMDSISMSLWIKDPEQMKAALEALHKIHDNIPDSAESPDIEATLDLIKKLDVDFTDPESVLKVFEAIQNSRLTKDEEWNVIPQTNKDEYFSAVEKQLWEQWISVPSNLKSSGPQIWAYSWSTRRWSGVWWSYENLSGKLTNEVSWVHLFQEDTREIEDPRVQLDLRKMHRAWKEKCDAAGIKEWEHYAITSVGRSIETHQDNLRRGTSKASISKHCFGAAFDAVPLNNGQVRWNHADRPLLDRMWKIWKEAAQEQGIGVKWWWDWWWDPYHFELATSTAQLKAAQRAGK